MGWWNLDAVPKYFWSFPTISINCAAMVKSDGSLDTSQNGNTPERRLQTVKLAHDGGKPIVFSVLGGNWGGNGELVSAISPTNRQNLVNNLMNIVNNDGYDGLDIDFEPVRAENSANFKEFARLLSVELAKKKDFQGNKRRLTAASFESDGAVYSAAQEYFDQIHIMTYDMSVGNPIVGFDSALYSIPQPDIRNTFLPYLK